MNEEFRATAKLVNIPIEELQVSRTVSSAELVNTELQAQDLFDHVVATLRAKVLAGQYEPIRVSATARVSYPDPKVWNLLRLAVADNLIDKSVTKWARKLGERLFDGVEYKQAERTESESRMIAHKFCPHVPIKDGASVYEHVEWVRE